jgi:hypothetical protein
MPEQIFGVEFLGNPNMLRVSLITFMSIKWTSALHCGLLGYDTVYMGNNILEEAAASMFGEQEDGSMFPWNDGTYLPDCTVSYTKRPLNDSSPSENLKSHIRTNTCMQK